VSNANACLPNSNRTFIKSIVFGLLFALISPNFAHSTPPTAPVPASPAEQRALAAISPDELKGDLSFLASDTLRGRFTPSPGLEVAAEFIASKFRAAGLEPGGDHDYFQVAEMVDRHLPSMTSSLTMFVGDHVFTLPPDAITVEAASQTAHLDQALVILVPSKDPSLLKGLNLAGKVVVSIDSDPPDASADQMRAHRRQSRAFDQAVANSDALVNVTVLQHKRTFFGPQRLLFADQATAARPSSISVVSEELAKFIRENKGLPVSLTVDIPAPQDTKVLVKNVIGILRGSDPVLSKTAVLLTAHYDHIGTVETASGMTNQSNADSTDRIYNGANDDGSGTVSVIEIARAIAKFQPHPKRSIVFMTFFGEERGELGSQFYGKHPVFPISQTIADLNLEQVGRTDSTKGPQLNNASVTGFTYSDLTGFLIRAGKRVGIDVYRDAEASDAYFTRSDNDALAEQGIPAHTLCVAFDYPDYHGLGDEWPKVDYKNMAKVDRMVMLALVDLANTDKPPQWNAQNPKTEPFRAARAAAR